ncbi:MAG: FAD-dependent monooxygenase [Sneathiellaceae bacterium]
MAEKAASIAVIGGGIGGLAAGLSLLAAGLDVHVYEQSAQLGEIGAGIQIGPNASRLLNRLGMAEDLDRFGVRPGHWHQRRWDDGRTLLRSDLGAAAEAAFGAPYYNIHRADLLAALGARLPAERLHLGHRLDRVVDHGDRVEARFGNGATIAADALVGADGIRSAVRAQLFDEDRPQFTGCIAYRGLVPAERIAHLDLPVEAVAWLGPGNHFVHYYVRGGQLFNFVAVIDRDTWTAESWTAPGQVADVLAAFEGWHPIVREIVGSVPETFVWGLFDHPPMAAWTRGRITLLGDSCHAMLPFIAQGAAQAIEDGACLAACLSAAPADLPAALQRYERLRLPRATFVQGLATRNKLRFHLPDGPDQAARDAEMAQGSTDWSLKAIAPVFGHDAGVLHDSA